MKWMKTFQFQNSSWRTKTRTTLMKTYRKVFIASNLAYIMSFALGQIWQKYGFPCSLWTVKGSHGIIVNYDCIDAKCTASMFFLACSTGLIWRTKAKERRAQSVSHERGDELITSRATRASHSPLFRLVRLNFANILRLFCRLAWYISRWRN